MLGGSIVLPYMVTAGAHSMPVTGYAWSSGIGWISFDGTTLDGSTYGVSEDGTTGALSGYAAAFPNIGWISFNPSAVLNCPSGTCAPKVDLATGRLSGWARACAAFADKNACSGALDQNSGGWDGWIALSGTAQDGSPYGVVQNPDCSWSGDAWGSAAIGAIRMSGVASDDSEYGVSGTNPTVCSGVRATLSANPLIIDRGESSTLTWDSTRATFCTASGGFSTGNHTSGTATVSPAVDSTYSITCTGPRGSSPAANATVTVRVPAALISAVPSRVRSGGTTTVSWNATNVNSCTITRNGVSPPWRNNLPADASRTVSGSATDTITSQTTYVITCINNSSGVTAAATATQIVNIIPVFQEF